MVNGSFEWSGEGTSIFCKVHRTKVAQGETPEGTVFSGASIVQSRDRGASELLEGFKAVTEFSLAPCLHYASQHRFNYKTITPLRGNVSRDKIGHASIIQDIM